MAKLNSLLCGRCFRSCLVGRKLYSQNYVLRTNFPLNNALRWVPAGSSSLGVRFYSTKRPHDQQWEEEEKRGNRSFVMYLAGLSVLFLGLSFAAVPLYRMFCQVSENLEN